MRLASIPYFVALLCLPALPVAGESHIATGVAERITQEAIAAGAAGDLTLRETLLQQAVAVAPDHAPARWAQGQMQVDGEWKSIAAIQDAAREDKQLERYRAMREASTGLVTEHLQIARWCSNNSMDDEARYHWLNVLAVNANDEEALNALDSIWRNGDLVPADQAGEPEMSRGEKRKMEREWRVRIAGWERALKAGGSQAARALSELDAEVDESAIPVFEKLAARQVGEKPSRIERQQQLCRTFIAAVGQLPSYKATESLVRFAVLSDSQSLRDAATTQLVGRPTYEYVPLLVEGLATTLESNFDIRVSPTGRVSYDHEVFAEGPEGSQQLEVARIGGAAVTFIGEQSTETVRAGLARGRAISAQHLRQFWAEAAAKERQVSVTNATRKAMNERIVAVLERASGKSFGNNPRAWWSYWYDRNGYESLSGRPVETYRTSTSQLIDLYVEPREPTPPPITPSTLTPVRRCECFAAGTLVWTKTGMEPIETLSQGDVVLTMDEQTGERCFRPVLDTTVREPSPLMHIATEGYQLFATPGHPFWVEGIGWRMARELRAGDRVLSAEGTPIEVRAVASSDEEQEAFNLVVEGNNNYFVGQEGLLSHDNTPRRPELARAGMQ